MVLIGGVAHAFDLNIVPEAVSKQLEPMSVLRIKARYNVLRIHGNIFLICKTCKIKDVGLLEVAKPSVIKV